MLRFRKDFLTISHPDCQQEDIPLLSGTKHKDRVLLHQPKTRNLLLKYSGITSDRKKIRNPKSLTQSEFSSLKASISKEGFQALADLLARLNSCRTRTCPDVNHQGTHSTYSHHASLFHQEPLIGRKRFLPILVLVPFLAEMAHQSPYRTGVLFLPILDQTEMCHNW